MFIRIDPHLSRSKILLPVPKTEWVYSRALPRDQFNSPVITIGFRLRAKTHDGKIVWSGWFWDREDADAFLFALITKSILYEKELWRLPTPEWHPGISPDLVYDFVTQTVLTTTGSNKTYTSPSDWNNSDNTIECLGGGGNGANSSSAIHVTGGGGGAYAKISNFSFAAPGTTTATYRVGAASGGDTWFNNATLPGGGTNNTKCGAEGGVNGGTATGSITGAAGGTTTNSWGQTRFAGGASGSLTGASGRGGSGGGGAAGPAGAGGAGVSSSATTNQSTTVGTANNGTTAGGSAGTSGNAGTEWTTHGCGSGGGGEINTAAAGTGGFYGGGGGGTAAFLAAASAGRQGLVVIIYTPAGGSLIFNPFLLQHILVR